MCRLREPPTLKQDFVYFKLQIHLFLIVVLVLQKKRKHKANHGQVGNSIFNKGNAKVAAKHEIVKVKKYIKE